MARFFDFIKNPKLHLYSFITRRFGRILPDKQLLQVLYYLKTGDDLNLKYPKGYREKIQWLKLYDRDPRYTMLVDKYLVKKYVGDTIGIEHVIPTLNVWDSPDMIDFDELPEQFVLKCNHNSHIGLCICNDKNQLNQEDVRAELWRGFNDDYYKRSREWAYKNVDRKIIAEPLLADTTSSEENVITDYKYFCFNGQAKIMYISKDIAKDPRTDFFDMEFNHLPIRMQDDNSEKLPEKPLFFEEMKKAAEKLARDIPFVRVDFYTANSQYYFGEMTFYPSSGMAPIYPIEWDNIIGGWITIPNNRKNAIRIHIKNYSEPSHKGEETDERCKNGGGYLRTLRHRMIPDWARKRYYAWLRYKEYKRMMKVPECEYEDYLCERYEEMMSRSERTKGLQMDFDNPITYSQKMQWMKLYDLSDEKTVCSDKYAVRDYVAKKIGEEYLIPLISIDGKDHFKSSKEIDFSKLPESFVLKCNHGSHYNIIIKRKSSLTSSDIKRIKKQLNKWLQERYEFKVGLELYYQGIEPCILIEEYMEIDDDLPDYKFYCFDGKVKFVFCMEGRHTSVRQTFFNPDFTKAPFTMPFGSNVDHPDVSFEKPENYYKMLEIASLLCKGFSHIRVDLYNVRGTIYFGELTLCSAAGYEVAEPIEYDRIIGDWIQIDQSKRHNNYRYRKH